MGETVRELFYFLLRIEKSGLSTNAVWIKNARFGVLGRAVGGDQQSAVAGAAGHLSGKPGRRGVFVMVIGYGLLVIETVFRYNGGEWWWRRAGAPKLNYELWMEADIMT